MTELWAELSKERPDGIITIGVVVLKDDDEPRLDLHPELTDAEDEEQLNRAFSIGDIPTGRYVGYGEGEEPETETEIKYERLSEEWFDYVLETLPKPYSANARLSSSRTWGPSRAGTSKRWQRRGGRT